MNYYSLKRIFFVCSKQNLHINVSFQVLGRTIAYVKELYRAFFVSSEGAVWDLKNNSSLYRQTILESPAKQSAAGLHCG